MKHHIKILRTAGMLGILAWTPLLVSAESTDKETNATPLISKDTDPREIFIIERLLTASPEQLARARSTIEQIEKMSDDEKKQALESIRKTLGERRQALHNLSPEEREKLRNATPEERRRMMQERRPDRPDRPERPRPPAPEARDGGRSGSEVRPEGRRGPGPNAPAGPRGEMRERGPQRPPADKPSPAKTQE